jgi:hypothetical protein
MENVCDKHTADTGRAGNLQGLDWPCHVALTTTIQEDWSATCASRWRRLNTFEHVISAESLEISLSGLEGFLLLTTSYPPAVKKRRRKNDY